MQYLTDYKSVVVESPYPDSVFTASPDLLVMPSGRYVGIYEFFLSRTSKEKKKDYTSPPLRVIVSDDRAAAWRQTARIGIKWPSLFAEEDNLYIIGNDPSDLSIVISASEDEGESWTEPTVLFGHGEYHGAASSVVKKNGFVYRAFERTVREKNRSPRTTFVLSGRTSGDLLDPSSWRMSNELVYPGTPSSLVNHTQKTRVERWQYPENLVKRPQCKVQRDGWCEGNVVDAGDRILVLLRLRTGLQSGAGMTAVCELNDSGTELDYRFLQFHPMPGAQCKFQIMKDEESGPFWTAVNLCTDTGRNPEDLWDLGFRGGPANERRLLVLAYSLDALNWFHAGYIAMSRELLESYSYASLTADGRDLLVLARTSESGLNQHDTNRITLHKITDFRKYAIDLHVSKGNEPSCPCRCPI